MRNRQARQQQAQAQQQTQIGNFKGESFGLGPGFIWFPEFAEGKLAVLGKWIHDFDATNRFESDYGTLTAAWTF